jgi:hypothetical protein
MSVRQDPGHSRGTMEWQARDEVRARLRWLIAAARGVATLTLVLALVSPLRAQGLARRPAPVDVQVIVLSPGPSDAAQISFTYRSPAAKGEPQRDLAALAAALRQPVPKARITTERIQATARAPRLTSVETTFRGLLDRPSGRLHVEPFARVFARFPHSRVTYLTDRAFRLKEPVETSLGSEVSATLSGQAPVINIDLWRGPSTMAGEGRTGRGRGAGSLALLFALLAAAAAGVAAYILARAWTEGRRNGSSRLSALSSGPAERLRRNGSPRSGSFSREPRAESRERERSEL